MHRSHVPVQEWFWAAYLVTTHTPGISAAQLARQLGISSATTAWHMLHRLSCELGCTDSWGMGRPEYPKDMREFRQRFTTP